MMSRRIAPDVVGGIGRVVSRSLPRAATAAQKTANAAPIAAGTRNGLLSRSPGDVRVAKNDTASTPATKYGPRSRTVKSNAAAMPAVAPTDRVKIATKSTMPALISRPFGLIEPLRLIAIGVAASTIADIRR